MFFPQCRCAPVKNRKWLLDNGRLPSPALVISPFFPNFFPPLFFFTAEAHCLLQNVQPSIILPAPVPLASTSACLGILIQNEILQVLSSVCCGLQCTKETSCFCFVFFKVGKKHEPLASASSCYSVLRSTCVSVRNK